MKTLTNQAVNSLVGRTLRVPERGSDDEIVWEDEAKQVPKLEEADVFRVLRQIIFNIPPQVLTRQDSIHATRLYNQLHEAMKKGNGLLKVEDAEWDWALKKLEDDKVGPRVFGVHCYAVEESLKEALVPKEKADGQGSG